MDWEYIYGMILIMKINFLEIGILENGKTGKEMDMENSFIIMVVFMKDFGKIIKKMGLEFIIILIKLNMLAISKMI
jgi:hypothetical protein